MKNKIKDYSKKTLTEAITSMGIHLKGLSIFLDSTNVPCIVIDEDCRINSFNQQGGELIISVLGKDLNTTEDFYRIFPKHIHKSILYDYLTALNSSKEVITEYHLKKDDGSDSWIEFLFIRLPFGDSSKMVLVLLRDISDTKSSLKSLYESEMAFKAMVQNSSDYITIVGPDGCYKYVSPSFRKRFSPKDNPTGKHFTTFLQSKDQQRISSIMHDRLNGSVESTYECVMIDALGNNINVETKSVNLISNPVIEGFVEYSRDVSDKKSIENQLKHEAYFDTLTKITNRQWFINRLCKIAAKFEKSGNPFALLFVDLDGFKVVNDTMGHNIGDLLLIEVARRLEKTIKKYKASVSRLGGDEFTIIIDSVKSTHELEEISGSIIGSLSQVFLIDNRDIYIGCSIGINYLNSRDYISGVDDYLRHADKAMYFAKKRGKGRFVFYDHDAGMSNLQKYNTDKNLRHAFDSDRFMVVYEPLMYLKSGKLYALKSHLVLIQDGYIKKSEFLTEETDSSIVSLLNSHHIDTVIENMKYLNDYSEIEIQCHINIADPRIRLESIYDQIHKTADIFGINEGLITLELHPSHLQYFYSLPPDTHKIQNNYTHYIDYYSEQSCDIISLLSGPIAGIKINWNHIMNSDIDPLLFMSAMKELLSLGNKKILASGIDSSEVLSSVIASGIDIGQGKQFCNKFMTFFELREFLTHYQF